LLPWQQNNLVEAERLLRLSLQDHKADAATMGFFAAVLDREQKFDEIGQLLQECFGDCASFNLTP